MFYGSSKIRFSIAVYTYIKVNNGLGILKAQAAKGCKVINTGLRKYAKYSLEKSDFFSI
jgi:hypothetical protein